MAPRRPSEIDPFASATTLLSALRRGSIGAAELTDLYIRRIERHDGRLNAVVVRDFDRARQQAKTADQARGRNEAKPLLGLPITLKESNNVAGLGTTAASRTGRATSPSTTPPSPRTAEPARFCSARPTCRHCSRTGNRPARSSGAPAIRGIWAGTGRQQRRQRALWRLD
jgi:hypothetical protein